MDCKGDSLGRCDGFEWEIAGIDQGNMGYPFTLHPGLALVWTFAGEGPKFSSTRRTGVVIWSSGEPCLTPCGHLEFDGKLKGTRRIPPSLVRGFESPPGILVPFVRFRRAAALARGLE